MLKAGLVLAVAAVVAMLTALSAQQGCRDLVTSTVHLAYFPKRDMRRTIGMIPQKTNVLPPDSGSVPVTGREVFPDRDVLAATFVNPQAPDDSSIARGRRKFMKTCVPCHGPNLAGDGPVAKSYIPPPDLLGETTRQRKDGYLYSYIRNGGVIMPVYGSQVTAQEAYDLINFIRHLQKVSPR